MCQLKKDNGQGRIQGGGVQGFQPPSPRIFNFFLKSERTTNQHI